MNTYQISQQVLVTNWTTVKANNEEEAIEIATRDGTWSSTEEILMPDGKHEDYSVKLINNYEKLNKTTKKTHKTMV